MSSPFPYARGTRQGSVEGPDMWNQVLDYALREPAARWESEKNGFKLTADYCRLQEKSRHSFSGEDMNGSEGSVLHHLCWADDLYAMAGSIEHLSDSDGHDQCCGRFGCAVEGEKFENCRWTLHRLQTRSDHRNREQKGQIIYLARYRGYGSAWHMVGQSRLFRNKFVAQDFRRATPCSLRKRPSSVTPTFRSASAYQPSILLVYPPCFMVQVNGLVHKVCSNRCDLGSWVNNDVFCVFEDDQMRAGLITCKEWS